MILLDLIIFFWFSQNAIQFFYFSFHFQCPSATQLLYCLQLTQSLLHLLQNYLIFLYPRLSFLHKFRFFQHTTFVMNLRKIQPSRSLIGDHNIPFQIIGLNFLQIGQHFGMWVWFIIKGTDDIMQLILIFLLGLYNFFFKKSKEPIHLNFISEHNYDNFLFAYNSQTHNKNKNYIRQHLIPLTVIINLVS